MDTESRAELSSCTFNTVLLTPKSEVAECDVVLIPGVEVKYEGSTDWPEESGLLGHVIMGQPVVEFDWDVFDVYLCGYEAYKAVTKSIPECISMKSGIAYSHIFAGSKCHFAVELHQNDYGLPQISSEMESGTKIMWFAVEKCNWYLIDTAVRDKLRYLLQSVCFRSGVSINFVNDDDASLYHQKKIIVNLIAADEVELRTIFPGKSGHNFCMRSILLNALKISPCIRMGTTSKNGETEELLSVLSNALYNFYQREAQVNQKALLHAPAAATVTSLNGREASEVDGVHSHSSATELQSMLQVDNDWLDEIKSNIVTVLQPKQCKKQKHKRLPADMNPMPRISVEKRLLLECPLCGMPFRSCRNRYESLVSHIKRRHSHCEKRLLRVVHQKYVVDS